MFPFLVFVPSSLVFSCISFYFCFPYVVLYLFLCSLFVPLTYVFISVVASSSFLLAYLFIYPSLFAFDFQAYVYIYFFLSLLLLLPRARLFTFNKSQPARSPDWSANERTVCEHPTSPHAQTL
jgi:hypothetical protein